MSKFTFDAGKIKADFDSSSPRDLFEQISTFQEVFAPYHLW